MLRLLFLTLGGTHFICVHLMLLCCCLSDREGRPVSEADQLALRSGRQPVRLVRKHGEDHEGTGLPDRKRHLHKVRNRPVAFILQACTDRSVTSANMATVFCLSYYASQKKTLEINPKHPLIKQMLSKVNVSLKTVSDGFHSCSFILSLTTNVSFFRRMQRTRRQKIWPWCCLRQLR